LWAGVCALRVAVFVAGSGYGSSVFACARRCRIARRSRAVGVAVCRHCAVDGGGYSGGPGLALEDVGEAIAQSDIPRLGDAIAGSATRCVGDAIARSMTLFVGSAIAGSMTP
jgi:hypothetical protein